MERVDALVLDSSVEIRLYSEQDVDIEQWHAQRVAETFQQVYGLSLVVKVKP